MSTQSARRLRPWAVAGWALPFALVCYLGLRGGGWGEIVRGEIAIVIWWGLLLAAVAGVLPRRRPGPAAWAALALLAGLALWSGLSALWAESPEGALTEAARVFTHLGVLAVVVAFGGPGTLRRAVAGTAAAIALIALVALGSRLLPGLFGDRAAFEFLPSTRSRLSYPLNYWNGLAALMAIGLPLLAHLAVSARMPAARAASAGATVVVTTTAYLTLSRGGVVEAAVAIAALLWLHPRRASLALLLAALAAATGVAIVAIESSDAVAGALGGDAARTDGLRVALVVAGLAALVACVPLALERAARGGLRAPRIPRRTLGRAAAATAVVAVIAAVALGAPGELSDRFERFKQPEDTGLLIGPERFDSAAGNGRWQYWSAAVDAGASEPLHGIGAGSFELWWAREATLPGPIADAHSLYVEAYGELGFIGLLLVLGLVGVVLVCGARRVRRAGSRRRGAGAAALAGFAAFAVAAGIDWAWELTVLPVAALVLAGALLGADLELPRPRRRERPGPAARAAIAVCAVAALAMLATTVAEESQLRQSRESFSEGDYAQALAAAETATRLAPSSFDGRLQQAFALEGLGRIGEAAGLIRAAIGAEPTNWRGPYALFELEARRGNARAALRAYRAARELNPLSTLFARRPLPDERPPSPERDSNS